VALETAMRARPVIAARVGGLPEVVVDGETGILVEKEDAVALADAALRLVRDRAFADRLGRQARSRALTEFDFGNHVNQYHALYQRLVASPRSAVSSSGS
jgi:glycosyltransferase involved in cell wall biosynthesis